MAKTTPYGDGEGAICTCLAVSNCGVDIGKQAELCQEFCPRLKLFSVRKEVSAQTGEKMFEKKRKC